MSDITEAKGNGFNRWNHITALMAALGALILYGATLAQGLTGEDSGEFIVGAYTLGVPHPPGAPLGCLIGHLFTWLPFGSIAWRVNLMSAVFGAATIYLVVLIIILETRNRWAAAGAALVFAATDEFWQQAVIAEVYTQNSFCIALSLLLLLRWENSRNQWTLLLFAVICGIGFTVHNTFVLIAPIYAGYVVYCDWRALPEPSIGRLPWLKYGLLSLLAALLTLTIYSYLWLASLRNPPLDWGNPENFANWWRHIRRSQYDFMFTQYPRSPGRALYQAKLLFTLYLGQGFLFLDLLGWLLWRRRRLSHALLSAGISAVVVVGFAFWQNFEPSRDWIWVISVFSIPAYLMAAVSFGIFLDHLRFNGRKYIALAPSGILAILLILRNGPVNDKSDYAWARDYGMNILNSLPEKAIYLADSDHGSFSVLYLQEVEKKRPDVTNGNIYGYLTLPELADLPESLKKEAGPFPKQALEPRLIAWVASQGTRPIFMEKKADFPPEGRLRSVPYGLLWQVVRPGETPVAEDPWRHYQWPVPPKTRGDFTADVIRCDIKFAQSRDLFLQRDAEKDPQKHDALNQEALQRIQEGLDVYDPADPIMLNNAGAFCARYGVYTAAEAYFQKALAIYPDLPAAHRNMERLKKKMYGSGNTP